MGYNLVNWPKVPISGHFHSSFNNALSVRSILVMVYANKAVQALPKADLVNVIVNQNNTST